MTSFDVTSSNIGSLELSWTVRTRERLFLSICGRESIRVSCRRVLPVLAKLQHWPRPLTRAAVSGQMLGPGKTAETYIALAGFMHTVSDTLSKEPSGVDRHAL